MNKVISILVLALLTLGSVKAQETMGGPQSQYGILENKLKKSEEQKTNEKKASNPKFWLNRGELMLDIWNVHMQHVQPGVPMTGLKLIMGKVNNIETFTNEEGKACEKHIYDKIDIVYKEGVVDSWVEKNKIYNEPLAEAYNSFKKAEELDTEGKLVKKLKENYETLKAYLDREGIYLFTQTKFDESYKCFTLLLKINEGKLMEGVVDTVVFYNAGMAASRAEKTDESIKYYELAAKYNHNEPNVYVFLKNKYMLKGDTTKAVEVLKTGFTRFPDAQGILVELINYYLLNDMAEEALSYLKIAQEDDPDNVNFIFAEGTLYDKLNEPDKAIAAYEKAIELKPDFFNGYFNLGVFYYNLAAKEYEVCNEIMDVKEYNTCKVGADETLAKAIPYMEKAHEIDASDVATLETLKTLYYRLKSLKPELEEKYNEVIEKLK